MRRSIPDGESPLLRQRQTDLYVVVVRKPDRPLLRKAGRRVELIPGEEHYETYGYHVHRGEDRITSEPLRPGGTLTLQPGAYRAVAVEQSGLESEPGHPLEVTDRAVLEVLAEAPDDSSWTKDRWLVDARETSAETARRAPQATCETVHVYDGVICRQWYEQGVLVRRHDLGLEGHAIRRTSYTDGRLSQREYHDREGVLLSREVFDDDGFITEWIRYTADGRARTRWHFDRGMPVREITRNTEYFKWGDKFGFFQDGRFVETPRGSISR
jgi:hypothetical protein